MKESQNGSQFKIKVKVNKKHMLEGVDGGSGGGAPTNCTCHIAAFDGTKFL